MAERTRAHFKMGAKISGTPTGRKMKLIFGGGTKSRRQKSIEGKALAS